MSDDWDAKTVIGRGTRGGGGNRDTVIRGSSQLNAAQRSGNVDSSRKYAVGNQAKVASGGQRLTKVDRSDDIIKTPQIPKEIKEWLPKIRNQSQDKDGKPMSQAELARLCGTTPQIIAHIEGSKTDKPVDAEKFNKIISAAERALKHNLRGVNAGLPMLSKREEKELAEKKAAEKKKAREEAKRLKEEEEAKRVKEEEEAAAAAAKAKEDEEQAEEKRRKEEAESGAAAVTGKLGKAKIADDEDDEDAEE